MSQQENNSQPSTSIADVEQNPALEPIVDDLRASVSEEHKAQSSTMNEQNKSFNTPPVKPKITASTQQASHGHFSLWIAWIAFGGLLALLGYLYQKQLFLAPATLTQHSQRLSESKAQQSALLNRLSALEQMQKILEEKLTSLTEQLGQTQPVKNYVHAIELSVLNQLELIYALTQQNGDTTMLRDYLNHTLEQLNGLDDPQAASAIAEAIVQDLASLEVLNSQYATKSAKQSEALITLDDFYTWWEQVTEPQPTTISTEEEAPPIADAPVPLPADSWSAKAMAYGKTLQGKFNQFLAEFSQHVIKVTHVQALSQVDSDRTLHLLNIAKLVLESKIALLNSDQTRFQEYLQALIDDASAGLSDQEKNADVWIRLNALTELELTNTMVLPNLTQQTLQQLLTKETN